VRNEKWETASAALAILNVCIESNCLQRSKKWKLDVRKKWVQHLTTKTTSVFSSKCSTYQCF